MSTIFENMTVEENDFLERMKTAPQEQIDHFRNALNQLMACYGENATSAILATYVDRKEGVMYTTGINMEPVEMLPISAAVTQMLQANVAAPASEQTH